MKVLTGTPAGIGGGNFNPQRTLYIYVRSNDVTSATAFQSPGTENWLNTLFYDPCVTGFNSPCVTIGGTQYGDSDSPTSQKPEGQTLLEDAGVTPLNPETCTDITTNTAC